MYIRDLTSNVNANKNMSDKMEALKLRNNRLTLNQEAIMKEVYNHFSEKFKNKEDELST